jgi:hypothetical protein
MRIKAIAFTVLLAVLFIIPQFAIASDPPKGFRNFKWGDRPSAGIKKFSGPTDGITMYVPLHGKKLDPLFDLPVAEEAYYFSKAGFYSSDAWLDGKDNFYKMKTALIKAFGQPTFSNDRSKIYKWKWPKNKIEIHLYYQPKFSRTTVAFSNNRI